MLDAACKGIKRESADHGASSVGGARIMDAHHLVDHNLLYSDHGLCIRLPRVSLSVVHGTKGECGQRASYLYAIQPCRGDTLIL